MKVIADTVLSNITSYLSSVSAFSILSDGSQARKTGSEKELVLVRLIKDGIPTYFTVALVDMDAERAIDDVFRLKVALPAELYTKLQVSATADGPAVNTGVYNGLMQRFS